MQAVDGGRQKIKEGCFACGNLVVLVVGVLKRVREVGVGDGMLS